MPAVSSGCTGVQTAFGSAVDDPHDFLITLLNSITAAGLYFVVASGFTLIFGLMRVVNMAHGAFFLLGGYIALKLQQEFVGADSAFGLLSSQVSFWQWLVPAPDRRRLHRHRRSRRCSRSFLRWNQGQELRQALITIAISIILADQMIAHFGAFTQDIAWPGALDTRVSIHVAGVDYSLTRLFILGIARRGGASRSGSGSRRHGRAWSSAPASTTAQMVSALGVNIQLDLRDRVLRRLGARRFRRRDRRLVREPRPGVDANWLLYSLVVVIIGGMGSLLGAAVGSLLLGARLHVRGASTSRRATRTTRSSSRSGCSRSCSRSAPWGSSGGPHERRSWTLRQVVERDRSAAVVFCVLAAALGPLVFSASGSTSSSRRLSSSASPRRA